MKSKLRRCAVAMVGALVVAGCASDPPSAPAASVGQTLDRALPASVLHAQLTDPAGRTVTLAALAGKIVVISDMLTLCQETCPLDTANVVAAARTVQRAGLGDRVMFLSITVDPRRDTRARLAAYQRQFAPAPRGWRVLTGAPSALAGFWKTLGVYVHKEPESQPPGRDWLTGKPLTYDVTHSDAVFFLDGHGRERFVLVGPPHVAAGTKLPPRLRAFLNGEGNAHLHRPGPGSWSVADELAVLSWLLGRRIQ